MPLRNPIPAVIALAAAALAAGCGVDAAPPAVDVTGTWSGPVESNAGPPGYEPVFGTYRMTLVLTQTGSSVTGTLASDAAFSGSVAGGVSGNTLTLRVGVAPCGPPGGSSGTVTLTGTVAAGPPDRMSVSYLGTPCGVEDHGQGILSRP
jgi:hypothetical protein